MSSTVEVEFWRLIAYRSLHPFLLERTSSSSKTSGLDLQHQPGSFFASNTPLANTLAQTRVQENSIPGEVEKQFPRPRPCVTQRHGITEATERQLLSAG